MDPKNAAPAGAPSPFTDTDALDLIEQEAAEAVMDATRPATAAPPPDASRYAAEAAMLMSFGLDMIGAGVGVKFDAATKAEGANRLAPVLAKYNGALPPWLKAYEAELHLGVWFAGVAFQTYVQVQAAKSAPAKPEPAPDAQA